MSGSFGQPMSRHADQYFDNAHDAIRKARAATRELLIELAWQRDGMLNPTEEIVFFRGLTEQEQAAS